VTRARFKVYAGLLLVFALGGVAGGASVYAFARRQCAELLRDDPEPRRMRALIDRLELDGDQERRVRDVFRRHRDERRRAMQSMFEECGAPLERQRKQTEREVRDVLTPEQRESYDRILKARANRYPERHHRRGREQRRPREP
jgi:Spy/CpxP family protein refolding chaperone